MKLATKYLGLTLKSPFVLGASPLTDSIDMITAAENAGASAIVLRSLFEEQIAMEERAFDHHVSRHDSVSAESAGGFFPPLSDFALDTEHYLEHIRRIKERVKIPVIGSLNGITPGGWERHSRLIEEAGADALELNFYDMPTDPTKTSVDVETRYIEILKHIRGMVKIPLAVKLSAFFSSLPNFVNELKKNGADGVVLFNRLYQSDIDVENLQVRPVLHLSTSTELSLRLRWLAILEPHFQGSLIVSGGVHTVTDAVKAIMAGASGIQMVSAIIKNGPTHFTKLTKELTDWLVAHEYNSVGQLRGSMSLRTCPDPSAFGRANYMKTLHGWSVINHEH
ncbi:dihydroorotate dehydrogenase-like protein [Bdellovibrionota bacterium FG-2]